MNIRNEEVKKSAQKQRKKCFLSCVIGMQYLMAKQKLDKTLDKFNSTCCEKIVRKQMVTKLKFLAI